MFKEEECWDWSKTGIKNQQNEIFLKMKLQEKNPGADDYGEDAGDSDAVSLDNMVIWFTSREGERTRRAPRWIADYETGESWRKFVWRRKFECSANDDRTWSSLILRNCGE